MGSREIILGGVNFAILMKLAPTWTNAVTASATVLAVVVYKMFPIVPADALASLNRPVEGELSAEQAVALKRAYAGDVASWPRAHLAPGIKPQEMAALEIRPRPTGDDAKWVSVGQKLFADPSLSVSGQISCQSCHNRALGWGDGLPVSFGHGRATGKRNAPSLISTGYMSTLFWDGRASSLEEQALAPLVDPREMANEGTDGIVDRVRAVDRLRRELTDVSGKVDFGIDEIAHALAAFQRTLERTTKFDRFIAGAKASFTDQELWGLHLFRTKAGCMNCHSGPLLTDGAFHNLGLSFFGRGREDLGRYAITNDLKDAGSFRTASLRHVSKTGPYMHNGIFSSLDGVVRFYDAGGGRVRDRDVSSERQKLLRAVQSKSPLVKRLGLTPAERDALVAYLKAL